MHRGAWSTEAIRVALRTVLLPALLIVCSPHRAQSDADGSPDPTGLPVRPAAPATTGESASPAIQSGADGNWYRVPFEPPPPLLRERQWHSIVFDPVRQRFVAFGGFEQLGSLSFNDLWVHDVAAGGDWLPLEASGTAPPRRYLHTAIYDPVGDRMIVFGGQGTDRILNDVWELTFSGIPTWTQLATGGTQPARRFGHSAVFDPGRDRMVIFGGERDPGGFGKDVFSLDFTVSPPQWSAVVPVGDTIPSRRYHAAIADPLRGRMVVFGGEGLTGTLGDVWTLSLDFAPTWTKRLATTPLGPRMEIGNAYDSANDRLLLSCGGNPGTVFNDVWAMDLATFVSSPIFPSIPKPSPRRGPGFAFDPASQTAILQGGYAPGQPDSRMDAWRLNLAPTPAWTELVPQVPAGLSLRYAAGGFFDAARDRFLMTGGGNVIGTNVVALGDLCELRIGRDSAWVQIATGPTNYTRMAQGSVYDPLRDRLLEFGGWELNRGFLNDLWEVRLSPSVQFNPLATTGTTPGIRDYMALIDDPLRDRLLLFGGNQGGTPIGDVWTLNLQTLQWSPFTPAGSPPPARFAAATLYDPYGDRMLMFGGFGGGSSLGDLWELSLSTTPGAWTHLTPSGTPPTSRYGASMVLDPNRQRLVIYGGNNFPPAVDQADAWELPLGGGPLVWRKLATSFSPPARYLHLGLFDGVHDRMFVSGGADVHSIRSDMWRLQFASDAVATAVALLSSDVRSEEVALKWGLSGDAATYARLERRDEASDWRTIESGPVSGSFVTYHDRDVVAGGRYGYRLTVLAGIETSTSSEVWIDVPAGPRFSLAGFSPNPATGEARVAFSLAARTPVTLEVVDVGGRRVALRQIESPAPGAQSIAIAPEGGLSPGLYFVRLVQGGHVLTARGTVMR